MRVTFVTLGLACIVAAIVGGGLKAFNIEIPGIASIARQALLAGFGVVVTVLGFSALLDSDEVPPESPPGTSTSTGKAHTVTQPTTATSLLPTATGRGRVTPCDRVVVAATALERSENNVTVRISVKNEGASSIDLPVMDRVLVRDGSGRQLSIDRFANLGGAWELGPEVGAGSSVDVNLVFDAPDGPLGSGQLLIREISSSDDPFRRCEVEVGGLALPN